MTAEVSRRGATGGAWLVARREIQDQSRDWRILAPILLLTLFFPLLMNFTARLAIDFVNRYGAPLIGDRLIPFLLMVVGFFPISISLVIALETFAGERERLSIEPLLVTPLTNLQLYTGKMIASLVAPVLAAYLGIFVYTAGLVLRIGWRPPPVLMGQVLLLTTAQALVMVSGAVVISSLTTSVRAANLLASFIIIPVAQLVILESLIMFWGRYEVLWLIVVGLLVTAVLLLRMGIHLFSREELLGRELDILSLRWIGKTLRKHFVAGARGWADWYGGLFRRSLAPSWPAVLLVGVILLAGFAVGVRLSASWPLPGELFNLAASEEVVRANLDALGFLRPEGWAWVFSNNVRAILLASVLGAFTFGVLGLVLLSVPLVILGYLAGNLAAAGASAATLMAALVLPHALFEIPAAILAGAAIVRWGMVVVSPAGGRSLGEHWLKGMAEWARLTIGLVLPLLALAALIEVFVTPVVALQVLFGG
ncbi:MAG TPA: stage II sporulation protein M [Anaerolineales bacterium]|nr:stage II sporulation protein M [Anaerolineales bacterium]